MAAGGADATVTGTAALAGPVEAKDRVDALDVLRGIALFGVFAMNFLGFAGPDVMATQTQLDALPSAGVDQLVGRVMDWLWHDKANTIFAFLFGIGFWLQLERAQAKGAGFEAIYLRRLSVLLLMGVIHFTFVWDWDILHVYALAGFGLFFLRKLPDRLMLGAGLVLALGSRTLQEWLLSLEVLNPLAGRPDPYGDAAIHARQAISQAGDYPGLVKAFMDFNVPDYYLSGLLVAWIFYALGRFMVGAWVGRKGWLQRSGDYLAGFRRVMWWTLPAGLIMEAVSMGLKLRMEAGQIAQNGLLDGLEKTIHLVGVPLQAAGYVCAIVVGLHSAWAAPLLRPFRWLGRMALTNYVMQSFVIGLVLFGVGPGLALAGRIGAAASTAIIVGVYFAQLLFSRWWLSQFRYGPLEWLWRGLTYGRLPPMRAPAPEVAVAA
jgi:uncharacterized protein